MTSRLAGACLALLAPVLAPAAVAQIIETPPGLLVEPDGLQWNHDVAYNSQLDEYLLVYPAETATWALRLDPCGNRIGTEVAYFADAVGVTMAAVGYNAERNEYLAVARYEDRPPRLAAVYLDGTGQPLSAPFPLAARGNSPTVHYVPAHQHYVVRFDWAYDFTSFQLVAGDSAAAEPLIGDAVVIADGGFSANVAYAPDSDQFLAVFTIDGPPPSRADIYGRFFSGDGSTLGPLIPLVTGFENQQIPYVVYMPSTRQWLVTWEEWNRVGQNHAADVGALFVGGDGEVAHRFSIMETADELWEVPGPMVYDPTTDRAQVTWFMGTATRMRSVAPTEGTLGPEIIVANNNDAPTSIAGRPHPLNPQVLVTWRRGYNGVYAGIVDLAGSCSDVVAADGTIEAGPDAGTDDAADAGAGTYDAAELFEPDSETDANVVVDASAEAPADTGDGSANAGAADDAYLEGGCRCAAASPESWGWLFLVALLRRVRAPHGQTPPAAARSGPARARSRAARDRQAPRQVRHRCGRARRSAVNRAPAPSPVGTYSCSARHNASAIRSTASVSRRRKVV